MIRFRTRPWFITVWVATNQYLMLSSNRQPWWWHSLAMTVWNLPRVQSCITCRTSWDLRGKDWRYEPCGCENKLCHLGSQRRLANLRAFARSQLKYERAIATADASTRAGDSKT